MPTISINPDMATREDIARLAAEYMELRHAVFIFLHEVVPNTQGIYVNGSALSWNKCGVVKQLHKIMEA